MNMKELLEKLAPLETTEPSDFLAHLKYRRENRAWLRKSGIIALKVLRALRAQGLSQKDLAEKMGVSPQQVSKVVKGQENLTLETIAKLELALGIRIIDVDVYSKLEEKPKESDEIADINVPEEKSPARKK
jgi:plasmid maintenance system antidote protein VapI